MLKRLFLKKSKKILEEVESAEKIMAQAQDKLNYLKSGNNFKLIREEIIRLIEDSNCFSAHMYAAKIKNSWDAVKYNDQLNDTLKLINECLDEMEKLTKENENATCKRKEG